MVFNDDRTVQTFSVEIQEPQLIVLFGQKYFT